LTLIALAADGHEVARLEGMPAVAEGGTEQVRIRGGWPGAPLNFELTWNSGQSSGPLRMELDLPRWHGQPVRLLPHFDRINGFVAPLGGCKTIRLEWSFQGNRFFGATVGCDHLDLFRQFGEVLAVLGQARRMAEHFQINPPLPADFGPRHAREIKRLHGLVTAGEAREPASEARISFELNRPNRSGLRQILADTTAAVPLVESPVEDQKLPFIGQEISVGKLEHHFTHTNLASDRKMLGELLARRTIGHVRLEFTTATECEHVFRSATD
jgi:hypothetical protein